MSEATTFIILVAMAFFFFLAPSKNFKQAFQAIAFVLFIGLAIFTLGTDTLFITEVTTHDHFYTPQPFVKNDVEEIEINQDLADNWIYNLRSTPGDDQEGQGLSIEYQKAKTTGRANTQYPDRLNIKHAESTATVYPFNKQDERMAKILTTDTAIRKVILEIEVIEDIRLEGRNNYLGLYELRGNGGLESRAFLKTGTPIGNGQQTVTFTIPPEWARNELALQINSSFRITEDLPKIVLYRITGLTIEKAPIPESKLEHIREERTYPVITFGDFNIAIAMIFIFLAMINLMIFMIDVVTWKRKTNSKTL